MALREQEIFDVLSLIRNNKYESILMLGVMDILLDWNEFDHYIKVFDYTLDKNIYECIKGKYPINTFDFFAMFGVKEVHAIDYSDYEGADIIFDLNNTEMEEELKNKFDLVIDGGTLEHVFCPNIAIKNVSQLVKLNGMVYHVLPCNGMVDHGFYSFSPTFFIDFYLDNGFAIDEIIFHCKGEYGKRAPIIRSQDLRLFPTARAINLYIEKRMKNDEVFIKCVARKKKYVEVINDKPIQTMFKEIYDKEELANVDFESERLISFLKNNEKIAFYGVGYDCDCLINELYKNNLEEHLYTLFDSNISIAGEKHRGVTIYYPTKEKLLNENVILISTRKYEDEVFEFLIQQGVKRSNIFRLTELQ